MFDFTKVQEVRLSKGSHDKPEKGMCFMEMAAWFAGEPHSDRPKCVSPALGILGIAINDYMTDKPRDLQLKPMIPLVVGTFDIEAEGRRIEYIVLRAFNYAMGVLLPEYAQRVRGGVQSVRDARHVSSWLRDYSRYGDPRRHYNSDMMTAMKYSMAEISGDPFRRRLASNLEEMLSVRLRAPVWDSVKSVEVCSEVYRDEDLLTIENAKAAAGVFANMGEIIPDWSAALDTLREAIKLGRHDGFTMTVNLEAQHKKLRELVRA